MMSCECPEFQDYVSKLQLRNKSILDIATKLSEQTARLNRAVFKSVTYCGCIEINACKQVYDEGKSLEENRTYLKTHIEGELCDKCREKIEEELGDLLYYTAAMCNVLGIDLDETLENKLNDLKTLGIYSLL